MRPESIKQFDRFFLGSLVLGLINAALSYQSSLEMLQSDAASAELGFGGGFLIAVIGFSLALPLLLWFLISRRASNVGKWILVVLTGLGLLLMIPTLSALAEQNPVELVLTLVVTALQLYAISFLFRGDAKAWLESKGKLGPTDPNIFD